MFMISSGLPGRVARRRGAHRSPEEEPPCRPEPAFAEFDGGETYPGPSVRTDGQVVGWVARTAQSNMHPTSTCRLGVDGSSVLDPATMGVHGVTGLSVADASAMPYCPSTATHGPTMMLAEKAADLILGNTPLAPQAAAVRAAG